jgi:hypothetical protein
MKKDRVTKDRIYSEERKNTTNHKNGNRTVEKY